MTFLLIYLVSSVPMSNGYRPDRHIWNLTSRCLQTPLQSPTIPLPSRPGVGLASPVFSSIGSNIFFGLVSQRRLLTKDNLHHPHTTPTNHCDFPRQRIFGGLWVSITHTMPLRFTCGSTPSVTFLINTPPVFLGPSLAFLLACTFGIFLLACTFGITEIKPCL